MRGTPTRPDDGSMTTSLTSPSASPPPGGAPDPVPLTPRALEWLTGEVSAWRRDGLVSDTQAEQILARYQGSRRFSLAALVLTLGASFVGVGLIWLVAANLDQLAPTARFLLIATVWVAITVAAEMLSGRREHGGSVPSPVVGAVRILAALAFGAAVFQAAQSLQVPAYEPKLVGLWSAGALLHAYVVRAHGPLLVGLATGTTWFLWAVLWDQPSPFGVVLALSVAAVAAVAVGALHSRWQPSFAAPWRELGAGLALAALFAAAIPGVTLDDFRWSTVLVVATAVAAVLAAAAVAVVSGWRRLEVVGTLAAAVVSWLLVMWDTGASASDVEAADWAHAAVAIVAYVAAAAGVAVLGVLRDSWRLTALATSALVVFATFQSFAVFAAILSGAWLFIALGVVFLATGVLFDRARRRLARELADEVDTDEEGASS
jgi:uncharacterized membrane protein